MNESDETLKQEDSPVLKAIAELSARLDEFKTNTNVQLEAIREGIAHNASKFDRLEATVFSVRSDISNLRADLRDLTEEVRQSRKTLA